MNCFGCGAEGHLIHSCPERSEGQPPSAPELTGTPAPVQEGVSIEDALPVMSIPAVPVSAETAASTLYPVELPQPPPNEVIYLLVKFDIVYHFCVLLFVTCTLF